MRDLLRDAHDFGAQIERLRQAEEAEGDGGGRQGASHRRRTRPVPDEPADREAGGARRPHVDRALDRRGLARPGRPEQQKRESEHEHRGRGASAKRAIEQQEPGSEQQQADRRRLGDGPDVIEHQQPAREAGREEDRARGGKEPVAARSRVDHSARRPTQARHTTVGPTVISTIGSSTFAYTSARTPMKRPSPQR